MSRSYVIVLFLIFVSTLNYPMGFLNKAGLACKSLLHRSYTTHPNSHIIKLKHRLLTGKKIDYETINVDDAKSLIAFHEKIKTLQKTEEALDYVDLLIYTDVKKKIKRLKNTSDVCNIIGCVSIGTQISACLSGTPPSTTIALAGVTLAGCSFGLFNKALTYQRHAYRAGDAELIKDLKQTVNKELNKKLYDQTNNEKTSS